MIWETLRCPRTWTRFSDGSLSTLVEGLDICSLSNCINCDYNVKPRDFKRGLKVAEGSLICICTSPKIQGEQITSQKDARKSLGH